MWSKPTRRELERIPGLFTTDDVPIDETIIYGHFFLGSSDWYVTEYDPQERLFFGYAILGGDYQNAEWGYVSYDELDELKIGPGFEVDWEKNWEPKKVREIKEIFNE